MKKCLLIIDVQNGFISPNTEYILKRINSLLNQELFDLIISTKFINKENSPYRDILKWYKLSKPDEICLFPPVEEKSNYIIEKYVYTAINDFTLNLLNLNNIKQVFILGIDTDCCVLKTAADLFEINIRPIILADYCASNGGLESHKAAIKVLERLIGRQHIFFGDVNSESVEKILVEQG